MNYYLRVSILGFLGMGLLFSVSCEAKLKLKNQQEKQSYAIGQNIGKSMKQQAVDIDYKVLTQGIKDGLAGKSALTDEEIQTVMTTFQQEQMKKQQEEFTKNAEANAKEAVSFLAKNKSKSGVITTQSGLQYKIDKKGTGTVYPKETDTVVVHYQGTLVDGSEFDSSYKRNQPATFPVNGVIKGWTEALQLMRVGDEYTLYVPSDLGYGERGAGPLIGPNKLLIFKVKLEAINPKTAKS